MYDRRTTGTNGLGAFGMDDSLRNVPNRERHRELINKMRAAGGEPLSEDKGRKEALLWPGSMIKQAWRKSPGSFDPWAEVAG
jgi:hypothetical protein